MEIFLFWLIKLHNGPLNWLHLCGCKLLQLSGIQSVRWIISILEYIHSAAHSEHQEKPHDPIILLTVDFACISNTLISPLCHDVILFYVLIQPQVWVESKKCAGNTYKALSRDVFVSLGLGMFFLRGSHLGNERWRVAWLRPARLHLYSACILLHRQPIVMARSVG